MNAEQKRFFLLGSNANREALRQIEAEGFGQVVLNVTRTSLASQVDGVCNDAPLLEKTGAAQGRLKFDFYKTIFSRLVSTEYDYLVLDVVDERFHLWEWREGEYLTASPELVKAAAGRKPKRIVRVDSVEYEKRWVAGFQQMITVLADQGQLDKLRVHRFWWAQRDSNEQPLAGFSAEMITAMNQRLQRRYDFIEMLVGAQVFIDYPRRCLVADASHKWGVAPFHYVDEASQYCYRDFVERRVRDVQPVQVSFTLATPARFEVRFESRHDLTGVEFACYLYRDDECVEQQEYQGLPSFHFMRPKRAGAYHVKAFMRSCHGAILVFDQLASITLEAAPERALLGADLIHDHKYQVNGFAAVTLEIPFDWSLNPFNDRTWRWNLLQLNMLPLLVGYDQAFASERGLDLAITLVRSWRERFLATLDDPEAWHDHCTAMRGSHLLVLLAEVKTHLDDKANASLAEFHEELLALLQVHAERLSCDDFYSEGTNHGFDQALTLGEIAEVLPPGPAQDQFRQLARQRIAAELNGAFAADGGHVENSPAYLNYGLKQALSAIDVLHAEDPDDRDQVEHQLLARVERSILALAHMVRPDGTLPIIGDTQAAPLNNFLLPHADRFQHYEAFLYAITQGRRGTPATATTLVLPDSGYAVFRDAWRTRKDFVNAVHCVMTCGFLSTYHRHDDDLSFVLMAAGVDWLVDGGLYNYQQGDRQRLHARSARAHNLSMPFGEQATRDRAEVATQLQQVPSRSADGDAVLGESNMFSGFTSTRQLDYVRSEGRIYVTDTVAPTTTAAAERVHQRIQQGQPAFVTRFQVPAELNPVLKGHGVELRHGDQRLLLEPCGEHHEAVLPPKIYPAGIGHQPESWFSKHLGRLEPLSVVEYRHHVDSLHVQFVITLP